MRTGLRGPLAAVGVVVLCCGSIACTSSKQAAVGSAYAGPATLNLRAELGVRTASAATARHGDRLEILETRRRFVKVRTKDGATGWTDSAYLLNQAQMDDLTSLATRAAKLPSQGEATVFDTLNVHTTANRGSPSFAQLAEGNVVSIIGHRATLRQVTARKASKLTSGIKSKEDDTDPDDDDLEDLPPPPSPPAVPQNWEALSRPRVQDLPGAQKSAHPAGDDWFLIRTPEGKVGWVLTRMVLMSIPDEITQNAAGHFIMGYHALGETADPASGEAKPNWLWSTSSRPMLPYDFDSMRLFVYNTHRKRYETAYVERNLKGYYPVDVQEMEAGGYAISLLAEDNTGGFQRRNYTFTNGRVHLQSKEPSHAPAPLPDVRGAETFDPATRPNTDKSWLPSVADLRKRWFGR